MAKGPPDRTKKIDRANFESEAMRKRMELAQRLKGGGRPTTILNSSVHPSSVGTTLLVGKG